MGIYFCEDIKFVASWETRGRSTATMDALNDHKRRRRHIPENKDEFLQQMFVRNSGTTELHLSGLTGTTRHPDMQQIRMIGFFFKNMLHWQFEVGKKLLQTAVLCYTFIYVQIQH